MKTRGLRHVSRNVCTHHAGRFFALITVALFGLLLTGPVLLAGTGGEQSRDASLSPACQEQLKALIDSYRERRQGLRVEMGGHKQEKQRIHRDVLALKKQDKLTRQQFPAKSQGRKAWDRAYDDQMKGLQSRIRDELQKDRAFELQKQVWLDEFQSQRDAIRQSCNH